MAGATLAQFIALHDQITLLVKAGVPVHLGLPPQRSSAVAACERIGAAVTRRVGEGATVQAALEDPAVPAAYRSVARLALESGDLSAALAGVSGLAETEDDSRAAVRVSLRYPLVICGLAYCGIVVFCLLLVPTLESMYQNMQIPAGWGLAAVRLLRSTLPFWIAIPPLALIVLVVSLRRTSGPTAAAAGYPARALAWLPGVSRALTEQRLAQFAETLAGHLDAGASLKDGLHDAATVWESDALQRQTLELAAAGESARLAAQFPPFLRWAIFHAEPAISRSRALRMAADLYRDSSQRRALRLRVVAPIVTCAVIGGGVTLLYALALFVPVAQMLQGLAG